MEIQHAGDKIKLARRKRQGFFIRDNGPNFKFRWRWFNGAAADDDPDLIPVCEQAVHGGTRVTDVERNRKVTVEIIKPIVEPVRNLPKQEIMLCEIGGGSLAMKAQCGAVKYIHLIGHGRYMPRDHSLAKRRRVDRLGTSQRRGQNAGTN
jgi:hypothetical protein